MNKYEKKAVDRMEFLTENIENYSYSYRCKLYHEMVELYNHYKIIRKIWMFIEDAFKIADRFIKKTTQKIISYIKSIGENYNNEIIFGENVKNFSAGVNQTYVLRIYDKNNNFLYSKIGKTENETKERMKQLLSYYIKDGAAIIYVDRVYNCGDITGDAMERYLQSEMIFKNPKSFIPTDRFNILFNLEELDRLAFSRGAEV